ncbi:MAG: hypothetical protein M1511_20200 [Deltaproteobacteria bacterium]|nr:hypothetical protein [Deltaproteobacteria bacterium]
MKRAIVSVLSLFAFAGVAYAENLNCRVVLRDMYAGDSQKTQNLLVPMLKNNELDGVTRLLSSGAVTLFEAGEKVYLKKLQRHGCFPRRTPGPAVQMIERGVFKLAQDSL